MLDTSKAFEIAIDHDGKPSAEGLAFFHTDIVCVCVFVCVCVSICVCVCVCVGGGVSGWCGCGCGCGWVDVGVGVNLVPQAHKHPRVVPRSIKLSIIVWNGDCLTTATKVCPYLEARCQSVNCNQVCHNGL